MSALRMSDVTGRHAGADFGSFFEAEYERLFQALYLACGDKTEAEDLAQEAMARAFERWNGYRPWRGRSGTSSRSPSTCTEAGFGAPDGHLGVEGAARTPSPTAGTTRV